MESLGCAFWSCLCTSSLSNAGFNSSAFGEVQHDLLSQKIVAIGEQTSTWCSALPEWRKLFDIKLREPIKIEEEVQEDIERLEIILSFDGFKMQEEFIALRNATTTCWFRCVHGLPRASFLSKGQGCVRRTAPSPQSLRSGISVLDQCRVPTKVCCNWTTWTQ